MTWTKKRFIALTETERKTINDHFGKTLRCGASCGTSRPRIRDQNMCDFCPFGGNGGACNSENRATRWRTWSEYYTGLSEQEDLL